MTSRRAFLIGSLGILAAPAIVRAESLMKIVVPKPRVITFDEWVAEFTETRAAVLARIFEDHMIYGTAMWQETPTGIRHVPIEEWPALA